MHLKMSATWQQFCLCFEGMAARCQAISCTNEESLSIGLYEKSRWFESKWKVNLKMSAISFRPRSISLILMHDVVIKWKRFPRYWPFARGIYMKYEFPAQRPVKRLSKQWWGWWFEMPSRPLWGRCNGLIAWVKSCNVARLIHITDKYHITMMVFFELYWNVSCIFC